MTGDLEVNWSDLLIRAQKGDSQAKNEICEKMLVRLRPIVKHRLWGWPEQDDEDIIQDTLSVFIEKLDIIKTDPVGYVLRILHNKIGNVYQLYGKRRKTHQSIDGGSALVDESAQKIELLICDEEKGDFTVELEKKDLIDHMRQAIKKLSFHCQLYFITLLDGCEVKEVWKQFKRLEPDLKRSAFDKRIFDCRKKLLRLVEGQV